MSPANSQSSNKVRIICSRIVFPSNAAMCCLKDTLLRQLNNWKLWESNFSFIPWKGYRRASSPMWDLTWFVTTTGIRENSASDLGMFKISTTSTRKLVPSSQYLWRETISYLIKETCQPSVCCLEAPLSCSLCRAVDKFYVFIFWKALYFFIYSKYK